MEHWLWFKTMFFSINHDSEEIEISFELLSIAILKSFILIAV